MKLLVGPNDCLQSNMQFIREDLVQCVSNQQQLGIVTGLSGDSSNLGLETINEDVDDENNCIPIGFARVLWLNSQERDEDVTNLRVLDRSFIIGDVVAPLDNPIGQTGIVMDISMSVDLELVNGTIVEGIDGHRLRNVRSYIPGDYVICNNWLGRIEEVTDNVSVMFDGGAKCKIFCADSTRLIPKQSVFTDEKSSPYFPGQKVKGANPGVFKSAKWLKGSWKETQIEGIVCAVEVGSTMVLWITSALTLSGSQSSSPPAVLQKPSSLQPLMYTSHTNWQLGNWVFLPPGFDAKEHILNIGDEKKMLNQHILEYKSAGHSSPLNINQNQELANTSTYLDTDMIVGTLDVFKQKQYKKQRKIANRKHKAAMKRNKEIEHAALVVNTKTKVSVMWQDGSKSCGIEASLLIPIEYLGDHDFWPEQYVLDQSVNGEEVDNLDQRIGIIKSVNATQRMAEVQWLEQAEKLHTFHKSSIEKNVSVYEIVEHPHFKYHLGDVVIRLTMNQKKEELHKHDKNSLDQGKNSCLEYEVVANNVVDGVEQIITYNELVEDASSKGIEIPIKEKQVGRKRGWEGKSKCSNHPTIDLSWVGNIIELESGEISVIWADGNISKVGPIDIFVVSQKDEGIQLEENEYQILYDSSDFTWSTLEYNEDVGEEPRQISLISMSNLPPLTTQNIASNFNNCIVDDNCNKEPMQKSLTQNMAIIQDASPALCNPCKYRRPISVICKKLISQMSSFLQYIKSQSSNLICTEGTIFCSKSNNIVESYCNSKGSSQHFLIYENIDQISKSTNSSPNFDYSKYMCSKCNEEATYPSKDVGHNTSPKSTLEQLNNNGEIIGLQSLLHSNNGQNDVLNVSSSKNIQQDVRGIQEKPRGFKQFDLVCGVADHHFVDLKYPNPQKEWIKKIQIEWKILEENLPNSIFVKVYEDRMDLLRAVIVGAQGTPYHDCLFVFDFHLPQNYPRVPPVAYYHSRGLRLNPNLYENGNVCLSLLNTWTRKGSEVWDASNSSILQVLISIQGQVLNATPYFNEARYEKQMGLLEGEKNSILYNENVFLLSCKSMLYMLCQPLQHIELIIQQHFKQRRPMLLQTCIAYMNGALVGSTRESVQENTNILGMTKRSTLGFQIMLEKLFVKLTAAFVELENQSNSPSLERTSCSIVVVNT